MPNGKFSLFVPCTFLQNLFLQLSNIWLTFFLLGVWRCFSAIDFFCLSYFFQIACRDYPHPRHLCAKFPFGSTPHERHCDQVIISFVWSPFFVQKFVILITILLISVPLLRLWHTCSMCLLVHWCCPLSCYWQGEVLEITETKHKENWYTAFIGSSRP